MVTVEILLKAYRLMRTAVEMAAIYEKNRSVIDVAVAREGW
jgi:hypothetical protein